MILECSIGEMFRESLDGIDGRNLSLVTRLSIEHLDFDPAENAASDFFVRPTVWVPGMCGFHARWFDCDYYKSRRFPAFLEGLEDGLSYEIKQNLHLGWPVSLRCVVATDTGDDGLSPTFQTNPSIMVPTQQPQPSA